MDIVFIMMLEYKCCFFSVVNKVIVKCLELIDELDLKSNNIVFYVVVLNNRMEIVMILFV